LSYRNCGKLANCLKKIQFTLVPAFVETDDKCDIINFVIKKLDEKIIILILICWKLKIYVADDDEKISISWRHSVMSHEEWWATAISYNILSNWVAVCNENEKHEERRLITL